MSNKPIVLVSLAIACALAADSMLYIVLPVFWQEAGLGSLGEVGVLLSINRFIRLPLNPLIGFIYSRIEIRTGLFIASVLAVIASLGYALGGGFVAWLVLRIIWGVAWALFSLGGMLVVIKYADETNRGQLMGVYNGLYRLGSLAGMLLGGLLSGLMGFMKTALFFGVLAGFSIVFVFFLDKVGEGEQQPLPAITVDILLLKPVLIVFATGFLVNMLYRGIINSTLSLIITNNFGLEIQVLGFVVGATMLAGSIQALRWIWEPFLAVAIGRWSDQVRGRKPLLIISLFLAAAGFVLITFQVQLMLWIGIICLILLCGTSLTTLTDALATDVAKAVDPLAIMTFYIVVNDLGAAIGPLLIYQLLNWQQGVCFGFLTSAFLFIILAFNWLRTTQIN